MEAWSKVKHCTECRVGFTNTLGRLKPIRPHNEQRRPFLEIDHQDLHVRREDSDHCSLGPL